MPHAHARTPQDNPRRFSHTDSGFTAAFELAMTPVLFAFFGYLLDGKLGTRPVFTIALGVVVLAYEVWKLWYGYNLRVDSLNAEMMRPRARTSPVPDPVSGDEP
jgi:hypothetical protein